MPTSLERLSLLNLTNYEDLPIRWDKGIQWVCCPNKTDRAFVLED